MAISQYAADPAPQTGTVMKIYEKSTSNHEVTFIAILGLLKKLNLGVCTNSHALQPCV